MVQTGLENLVTKCYANATIPCKETKFISIELKLFEFRAKVVAKSFNETVPTVFVYLHQNGVAYKRVIKFTQNVFIQSAPDFSLFSFFIK
jgi:hypothetical protein